MTRNIILTGAMGSGKSTVLKRLKAEEFIVVEEPAREILAEQRNIGDEGTPEKNPKLFTQLLLSRAICQFKKMQGAHETVIFDRGIPDNIAYAQLFELNYPPAHHAARLFQYHPIVFFFPAWETIYTPDDERTMTFKEAQIFGDSIHKIYQEQGYTLIEVPCTSPEKRMQFIKEKILLAY